MRIIAGNLKGRVIRVASSNPEFRPTSDRVREALFSSLESRVSFEGLRVLDLYAGSGALGLEALSRGADEAVFVEQNSSLIKALDNNISRFGVSSRCRLISSEVEKFLFNADKILVDSCFDIVFADPPYSKDCFIRLASQLQKSKLIKPGSILVFESAKSVENQLSSSKDLRSVFSDFKEKSYGSTTLSYLEFA